MKFTGVVGVFAVALVGISACDSGTEKASDQTIEFQAAGPAQNWTCANGETLSVVFQATPEAVEITTMAGAQLMLPPAKSETAVRYESEVRFFEVSADQALWKDADREATTCYRK